MQKVEFEYNGKIVEGILLATYQREETNSVQTKINFYGFPITPRNMSKKKFLLDSFLFHGNIG